MFRFYKISLVRLLAGLFLAVALAACDTSAATPTPIAPTPTPPANIPLSISPAPTLSATRAPGGPITLTIWAPSPFSPGSDNPIRQMLIRQYADFAASPDGTPAMVLTKKDRGPGGLLDLLKTAKPVAPEILPDLIALDTSDLEIAARAGLLQPIDRSIPTDFTADFFPAARDLGSVDGELYGLVYSLDLEHAAYNTKVTATAPITWSEILTATRRYVFAVHDAGTSVSEAVLAQYFALGGTLLGADQQPALDQDTLIGLLNLYQQAQRKAVLPADILDFTGPIDTWAAFNSTGAAMVNVPASRYILLQNSAPTVQFAALPAFDHQPTAPIARGWALALVTRDPRRQAAALRLAQWLLAPERNGAWTESAGVLPGRLSALSQWDQTHPYTGFIRDQLLRAQAAPSASILTVIGPALRKAIDDVLTGKAAPTDAAQAAIATVNTGKK
jgi:ABC-type glycerol-3-phosphate transport system substrate-binding protein